MQNNDIFIYIHILYKYTLYIFIIVFFQFCQSIFILSLIFECYFYIYTLLITDNETNLLFVISVLSFGILCLLNKYLSHDKIHFFTNFTYTFMT